MTNRFIKIVVLAIPAVPAYMLASTYESHSFSYGLIGIGVTVMVVAVATIIYTAKRPGQQRSSQSIDLQWRERRGL